MKSKVRKCAQLSFCLHFTIKFVNKNKKYIFNFKKVTTVDHGKPAPGEEGLRLILHHHCFPHPVGLAESPPHHPLALPPASSSQTQMLHVLAAAGSHRCQARNLAGKIGTPPMAKQSGGCHKHTWTMALNRSKYFDFFSRYIAGECSAKIFFRIIEVI